MPAALAAYKTERIIGAAVRTQGGRVFWFPAPERHHDVLHYIHDLGIRSPRDTQGFMTDRHRFVNRTEAYGIAEAAGQLIPRKPGEYDGPELFSEDVW